jgi:N utilization substance protein B
VGARTTGREAALQVLFALDSSGGSPERALAAYFRDFAPDTGLFFEPEAREFAEQAVAGVTATQAELDALLRKASTNWRLERMSRVDRNVLRLAAWELVHRPDVPRPVILDEAVELAKRYGTLESRVFVNGVIDRIADLTQR